MSDNVPTNCTIKVLEKEYAINCQESEVEMLMESSKYLNNRIKETRSAGNVTGSERVLVMTALNIIYDLLQINDNKSNNQETSKKINKINNKIEKLLHQNQQIDLTH